MTDAVCIESFEMYCVSCGKVSVQCEVGEGVCACGRLVFCEILGFKAGYANLKLLK